MLTRRNGDCDQRFPTSERRTVLQMTAVVCAYPYTF